MRDGFASKLKKKCLREFLAQNMGLFLLGFFCFVFKLNVPAENSGFLYKNKIMRYTSFPNLSVFSPLSNWHSRGGGTDHCVFTYRKAECRRKLGKSQVVVLLLFLSLSFALTNSFSKLECCS